jgi:ATP-dependent DNA ligase
VWRQGRLAFGCLSARLNRPASAVTRLAVETPAHFVLFDVLHGGGADLLDRPYRQRRAALEELFAVYRLGPPWTLCPAAPATDVAAVRTWLSWSAVGVEGLVFKDPGQKYLPGVRGWHKYRVRHSTEAVIGAVTGTLAMPTGLLLGRFDGSGRLRFTGHTGPLPTRAAEELAALLAPAGPGHPWEGRTFSVGWRTGATLDVTLADPALVAEVSADIALDGVGRWRHPVRFLRARADLTPMDTPGFGSGNEPAVG